VRWKRGAPAAKTGALGMKGEAILTDRGVAIVTGGASGIGLAIAKALLGDGWKLIIADLAQGPLDARWMPPAPS
jgi:hypothetical protein